MNDHTPTGTKETEAALRESEMRHLVALDAARMSAWEWNLATGRVVRSGEIHEELWGYAPGTFPETSEAFLERVHPEDRAELLRAGEEAERNRRPFRTEFRVLRPDGTLSWVASYGRHLFDDEGRPTRIVGVVFDVTEKRLLEDLQRVQRELATALAAASDLATGLRLCLDAALEYSGLDSGGFYLVDARTGALDLVTHRGLTAPFVRAVSHFPPQSPQARRVAAEEPLYVTYSDLMCASPLDEERREGLRFLAAIPLSRKGAALGCFNVASHRTDDVPPMVRKGLESLAATAAHSIARLNAQEALREREELFSSIVGQAMDAVALVESATGRFVEFNASAHEGLGYTREEFESLTIGDIQAEHSSAVIRSNIELMETRGGFVFETKHRCRNGEVRDVWVRAKPLRLGHRSFGAAVWTDITERKTRENEIERLTRLYSALSQVNQVIVRAATRDELLWEMCRVLIEFGKFRMAWIGWVDRETRSVRSLAHHGDETGYLEGIVISIDDVAAGRGPTGRAVREERTYVCNDFFSDPNTVPWRDAARSQGFRSSVALPVRMGGTVCAALMVYAVEPGFFGDKEVELLEEAAGDLSFGLDHLEGIVRSERAEAERALLERQFLDAQKMEALGTLAGGVAHDFNNILTPIIAHAELALMQLPEGDPVRENVSEILVAGQRAADLTRQILSLSRREEDRPVAVGLAPLVKEAARFMRASLPATINICTMVDPACGPVLGDLSRLHQVIMNLCTNARDAMQGTGGVLTLSLEKTEGDCVKLSVHDTGAGIAPEVLGKIFEPYFTTKVRGKGTGLGLATVRSIVAALGGSVSARSEQGAGTTFEVVLPQTSHGATPAISGPQLPLGNGERVLVVDDEPAVVSALERVLTALGYRPRAYCRSSEALEAFAAQPTAFDAVITDYTMPEMTGVELAGALRRIRPGLPIVLGTGNAEALNGQAVTEQGLQRVVLKPYSQQALAEALREALEAR